MDIEEFRMFKKDLEEKFSKIYKKEIHITVIDQSQKGKIVIEFE